MLYDGIKSITKMCSMCNNEVELQKHPDGLIVNDEHIICQNCCINTEKELLTNFIKEKSMGSNKVRPIMLWLFEKQR